ncbi:MAG: aminotransferase class I/II-fold pyridoxal phosphate-dependent enzyme [Rhodobacteraceae bacterium]|nr:aminotransferase class I/II-fold pyridoxal phosphate-dependent enzyme [Paracoccaceae bacterium]
MQEQRSSFLDYAERRYRLAGSALVAGGNHPYFVQTDLLENEADQWSGGFLSLSHYDYLGMMHDPQVTSAAKAAIDQFGTGAGGSRLVGGERSIHRAFEAELAEFLGVGGVLSIISGYLTNMSIIGHVMTGRDLVVADELAHNSIISGCKAAKCAFLTYPHNDLEALDALLSECREDYGRVLIATDGLFSMDGDITDLPRLLDIKEAHNAWLLLDEAHSYGVLGETGRGLSEHFGIDPQRIEIAVGTLSKSFGASGGFIAADAKVIEWLKFTLPGFVYSVGLAPSTVASARAALGLLKSEPQRVARLRKNSRMFLEMAQEAGLDTGDAIGEAVVPVLFDGPEECVFVAGVLLEQGIYAPPVVHVGIPKDAPRVRCFISAKHDQKDFERTVHAIVAARAAFRTIGQEGLRAG